MLPFLKNHPFAVEAFFESSIVLTFAFPKQHINHLIPPCVQADTFNHQWAFIAVAMVQTKGLRPKGFATVFGNDFFLVGYRVFVRYVSSQGKHLRGLYILKSHTDKTKMAFLGNLFTHYRYTTTDIHQSRNNGVVTISSLASGFKVSIDTKTPNTTLPVGSPFSNWKEARRFAGPLPYTFTYHPQTKNVLVIEGVRDNWVPRPVQVLDYHFSFFDQPKLQSATLANAFIIENVPYYWKKGKLDPWTPS